MILVDDRTDDQKRTHTAIILMTNRFMSNWPRSDIGVSYTGWACRPKDCITVERWVRSRGDAMRVRRVGGNYRPPAKLYGYCDIYVVGDKHPSLRD